MRTLSSENTPEEEAERAAMHERWLAEQQATLDRIQLRRKYRAARTVLDQPIGTTQAQVRQNVVEHRNILSGLIEILKDSGLLLDD